MYGFIITILKVKRLPPLITISLAPLYPFYWAIRLVFWLLGYWFCSRCKKIGWINDDMKVIERRDSFDEKLCVNCVQEPQLITSRYF